MLGYISTWSTRATSSATTGASAARLLRSPRHEPVRHGRGRLPDLKKLVDVDDNITLSGTAAARGSSATTPAGIQSGVRTNAWGTERSAFSQIGYADNALPGIGLVVAPYPARRRQAPAGALPSSAAAADDQVRDQARQLVWCEAPRPAPVLPWKYSWKKSWSRHAGSSWSRR